MYHAVTPEEWDVMHELHGVRGLGVQPFGSESTSAMVRDIKEGNRYHSLPRSLAISLYLLLNDDCRLSHQLSA